MFCVVVEKEMEMGLNNIYTLTGNRVTKSSDGQGGVAFTVQGLNILQQLASRNVWHRKHCLEA
jgi:hypothetical protein